MRSRARAVLIATCAIACCCSNDATPLDAEEGTPQGLSNASEPGELADLPFGVSLIDLPGDTYNFYFTQADELTWRGAAVSRTRFGDLLDSFVQLHRKKQQPKGVGSIDRPPLVLHPWRSTKWSAVQSWMNEARRKGWSICYIRGRPRSYQKDLSGDDPLDAPPFTDRDYGLPLRLHSAATGDPGERVLRLERENRYDAWIHEQGRPRQNLVGWNALVMVDAKDWKERDASPPIRVRLVFPADEPVETALLILGFLSWTARVSLATDSLR